MIISLHTKGQNVPHCRDWCPVETRSLQEDSLKEQKVVFLPSTPLTCFSLCSELSVICGDLGVVKHFECTTEKLWQQSLRAENNNNKRCLCFHVGHQVTSREIDAAIGR